MLKPNQGSGKHNVQQMRRQYQKILRKQELQALFAAVRKQLQEEDNNQNDSREAMQPQLPLIPTQPLPHNYFQQLTYFMRMIPLLKYPNQDQAFPTNSIPALNPIMQQIDQNIYFQKNGIVVYKNLLGRGTYAQVWEGKVKLTGEKVAAKQVNKLQENQRRCLQELKSQHVVKVIDIFTHWSKSFIILEFCDKNLREELQGCKFQLQMALKYFEQLVCGMDILQSKKIIHRDLKFENILVKDSKLKIADFGLAKCLGSELQVESRRCGTPYTMAPEIYFALTKTTCYTIKSDIWAMGIILHEMLYHVHPFEGCVYSFKRQKRAPIIKRFGILDKIIDECLVFDPAARMDWSQFKTLFNYYLQEKQYYIPSNQKSSVSFRLTKQQQKACRYQGDAKEQALKLAHQVKKTKERYKEFVREREESKDRREDRTPVRRRKATPQKKAADKDKFQYPYQRNRRRLNYQQPYVKRQVSKGRKQQKQPLCQPNPHKVEAIEFGQQEQRAVLIQKRQIIRQGIGSDEQLKPTFRMWQQLLALSIFFFVLFYVSFD